VATNRLPAASRKRYDNSTINPEIGARPQAACGSTLTLGKNMKTRSTIILMSTIFSWLNLHAVENQSSLPKKVKFKISNLHDGLYVPYRTISFRGVFTSERLTIKNNTFHYKYFTDVVDAYAPDFKGAIRAKKDIIFLDHPGMSFPYRVTGKLEGRPVILTWRAHQKWLKDGLRPSKGILYLTIIPAKSPLRQAYRSRGVSKGYPFYTGDVGNNGAVYFKKKDGRKYITLAPEKPYGIVSEEGKGALFAETVDTELTVKEVIEAINNVESELTKYHGEITMKKINGFFRDSDSSWVMKSRHSEDIISSVCILEVTRELRKKLKKYETQQGGAGQPATAP